MKTSVSGLDVQLGTIGVQVSVLSDEVDAMKASISTTDRDI